MALPTVSFKEFAKNPIVALLFMAILAIGYLHNQQISTLEDTIVQLRDDVDELKKENKELRNKLLEITKN
jgi:cell division protein FtsB